MKKTPLEFLRQSTGLTVTDLDAVRMQTQISYVVEAIEAYAKQEVETAVDLALMKCSAKAIIHSSELAERILSLKPEIMDELLKL